MGLMSEGVQVLVELIYSKCARQLCYAHMAETDHHHNYTIWFTIVKIAMNCQLEKVILCSELCSLKNSKKIIYHPKSGVLSFNINV